MKKIINMKYSPSGKKIYIYNPDFIASQSKKKFERILKQHKLFQKIKKSILKDIRSNEPRKKEIAIILYLIIYCGFRIGNKRYEKQSYGISTIKFKHIPFVSDDCIEFDFIGKKSIRNISKCSNKDICKYLKNKKKRHSDNDYVFPKISSQIVNDYLKEFDENLTSKDLRTWVANILFVKYVVLSMKKKEKHPIKSAIIRVSQQLHNTPAVCKKNYIDEKVVKHIEEKIKNDDIK